MTITEAFHLDFMKGMYKKEQFSLMMPHLGIYEVNSRLQK